MDKKQNSIIIPIKGLACGRHCFDFIVNGEFFSEFGNSQIKDAHCEVVIEAEKNTSYMGIDCRIDGKVIVECDRCLEDLVIPIDIDRALSVKFAKESEESDDDDIMILDERDADLDLNQFVYDYICLAVPLQKIHPDGECDIEMIKRIAGEDKTKGQNGDDTPFSNLKDLLNNKNN
ncbi:MAG: DUF177 domain-containing protein [Bacteroidales bacterium]|nr:DUF177 domain-containing protein [Bacteroidales bacterium]MDD4671065.1 DUF177 domain-containing protein [Bacteroidales bacterium]